LSRQAAQLSFIPQGHKFRLSRQAAQLSFIHGKLFMKNGFKNLLAKVSGKNQGTAVHDRELAELAGRRAENFFREHRLSCSEAALLVVNLGFKGGLTARQALSLGSGFGGGVGGSGCVCGALSGAVMALGLFLGPDCNGGLGKNKFRKLVGNFHDSFRGAAGAVCCRELLADFRKDRKGQALFCRGLTGRCTGEAVRIILQARPELAARADLDFLRGHDSAAAAVLRKLLGRGIGESDGTDRDSAGA
jgi:C_GCAxxG_C_C family probable redox protein